MATSMQKTSGGNAAPGLMENQERERVFDLFRQWGYLEADLNPLGLQPPQAHGDLKMEGEWAEEARRIYCGTVGVEFMHIEDPEWRRWIAERMERETAPGGQERAAHPPMGGGRFED